jgi:hypothetical protein
VVEEEGEHLRDSPVGSPFNEETNPIPTTVFQASLPLMLLTLCSQTTCSPKPASWEWDSCLRLSLSLLISSLSWRSSSLEFSSALGAHGFARRTSFVTRLIDGRNVRIIEGFLHCA